MIDKSYCFHKAPMKSVKSSGYDVAVGPSRFFLQLFGVWPDPFYEGNWFCYIRASIVISTMVFFASFTQTVKNIQVWGDLNVVTEIFINSEVPTSTAAIKVLNIIYHRRALRKLMLEIVEDWRSAHTSAEFEIMEFNAKFSRLVSATCIFLANATFVIQGIIAVLSISAFSKSLTGQENDTVEWPLYMKASFPYNVQASPNYELTFIGQLFSNFFAASTYTSIDALFVILMMHLCGQLSVLRLTLISLSTISKNQKERQEFERNIAYIHSRHDQLTRFAMTIEHAFNMPFLIQMLTSSFVLCMQGYQLITITRGNDIPFMQLIFMLYYIVCFLFITFTYCYMAEKLREKSTDIADAAYNCDWFELPHWQSKSLIMIIIRASRPFEITAGKFVSFSLRLYCSILKKTGGFVSVLLAVQERLAE